MILQVIQLTNFRNFDQQLFDFNRYLTVIVGENARGKTNLLESIYTITNGSGFREAKEEELINFEKKEMTIKANFYSQGNKTNFEIWLKKKNELLEKIYFYNKTRKRLYDYSKETPKAVLFTPEQIRIINGPPDERRSYFDRLISHYDLEYKKKLANYESALRKRNKILEIYHDAIKLAEELAFWDSYLIEQASYLSKVRQQYVDSLNQHQKVDSKKFKIVYLKNEFSWQHLKEVEKLEKRVRRTMIGLQKDDYAIFLIQEKREKNLQHYGSRSEQRLAVFWLKLNEIKYLENKFKVEPILLLDDVFSELDLKNKKLILDLIRKYQTVITTTEENLPELTKVEKTILKI